MSELIQARNCTTIRNQILASASALALVAYIAAGDAAKAEDSRPTVWIELGGQMEQLQGVSSPFTPPFMTAISPTPGPYANNIFLDTQRPARLAFGLDGGATFQSEGSDWVFSINLRYGRSGTNRHIHQQSAAPTVNGYQPAIGANNFPFSDSKLAYEENHAILDFSVGKDVGLGAFGHDATSTISGGVRFAQFSNRSKVNAMGRPEVNIGRAGFRYAVSFYNYTLFAEAARSFRGVGPSLSWKASAALLGNKDAGELTFDWGINGALLFGRQKAEVNHATQAYHMPITQAYAGLYDGYYYSRVYSTSHQHTRSRAVAIPNLGGFAGVSVKYPNAKFSLGYRADFFFGAVDAGVDARRTKTLGFTGPFASVSIGLGG
jgi:iron complex outermembrane receptor protein